MHKIIILAAPADGHFNPLVPIMSKLVLKGHTVVCITGRNYKNRVENTGSTFHPTPVKWDPGDKEIYDFFPGLKKKKGLYQIKYYIKHTLYDPVPDILNLLATVLENFHADVVISDTFSPAGVWITALGGPPSIRVSVLPLSLPGKNIAPHGLGFLPGVSFFSKLRNNLLTKIFDNLLSREVQNYANKIRKDVGLPTHGKKIFIKELENPNLLLHMSIPSFEYPRNKFPANFRFIGPVKVSPDPDYIKPDWWPEIEKDLPVVLVNQGTVAKNYDDLIRPAIEALKDEQMIILAVPVKEGEIRNLPGNVHTEPYIPFGNILPHIDIMITNGGFGGTQNALAHGIPIVIAGATEDKMEVAARLEYTGAGINLRKQNPSPENIKKAVRKIMSDSTFKQKAEELQTDYAKYDSPSLAVGLVEELIEKPKS